jgi:hypothetical protein
MAISRQLYARGCPHQSGHSSHDKLEHLGPKHFRLLASRGARCGAGRAASRPASSGWLLVAACTSLVTSFLTPFAPVFAPILTILAAIFAPLHSGGLGLRM